MKADKGLSLAHHFADLTDPRIDRSRLHELLDIVTIAICAVIAGADTWDDIEDFGKAKHDWLKTFLDLPNGIPSHDTFRRLFERLDPDEFQRGFLSWIEALHEATERQVVAIDGKTLRRSFDRANGKSALHMVHAWATANHLLLGQIAVDQKSNEITAIPKLLRMLEITGAIVTIDAMGCPHGPGAGGRLPAGVEGESRAPVRGGQGVLGRGACRGDDRGRHRLSPGVERGARTNRGPSVLGHGGPHLALGTGGVEGPAKCGDDRSGAVRG
jgi:predicted transposase YbfD/YdcC